MCDVAGSHSLTIKNAVNAVVECKWEASLQGEIPSSDLSQAGLCRVVTNPNVRAQVPKQ